jgi:hypothetical protein
MGSRVQHISLILVGVGIELPIPRAEWLLYDCEQSQQGNLPTLTESVGDLVDNAIHSFCTGM